MFRFAYSLLSNRQEAEDAVQEVYLKMWGMRSEIERYKSTEALMMTITKNLCLDKIKIKKNKAISLDVNNHLHTNTNPQDHAEQTDMVNKVLLVMQQLPEQQKVIVHLRDVEGCDFEEIMKITGNDMNYVRVNLSRGRKKIRETIQNLQKNEAERYS